MKSFADFLMTEFLNRLSDGDFVQDDKSNVYRILRVGSSKITVQKYLGNDEYDTDKRINKNTVTKIAKPKDVTESIER